MRLFATANLACCDGSCAPGYIPELARAGWAVAAVVSGRLTARLSAPAWGPTRQTSQAAECCSFHATQVLAAPTPVASDCAAVVGGAAKLSTRRGRLDIARSAHGGIARDCLGQEVIGTSRRC